MKFRQFWNRYPALLYLIATVIGVFTALNHWAYFLLIFTIPYRLQVTLFIAAVSTLTTFARIDLPIEEVEGQGRLSISRIGETKSSFSDEMRYQGTLVHFTKGRNIPVFISLKDEWNRPSADQDYLVTGTLIPGEGKVYRFKVSEEDPWIPLANTYSFAEMRFHAKQWLANKIGSNVHHKDTSCFLVGIATGEFDNPLLQFEFSRFGLQHIMAISGFHFSLIAAFLTVFLRLILSQRKTTIILLLLMSGYFLFLGPGPSVLRAFSTLMIALISLLVGRNTSGLNALGFGCLLVIAYDPLLLTTIGFPFSALTTGAILLYYPFLHAFSKTAFKHRLLDQALSMSCLHRSGYAFLHIISQTLALTVAVNLITVPLSLYYFQQFPTLSIVYNFFFPFLVSISMFLLLISLASPPLAPILFPLNDSFTHAILSLTSNLPTTLDFTITSPPLTPALMVGILICLLYLAIFFQKYIAEKNPNHANYVSFHGGHSSVG